MLLELISFCLWPVPLVTSQRAGYHFPWFSTFLQNAEASNWSHPVLSGTRPQVWTFWSLCKTVLRWQGQPPPAWHILTDACDVWLWSTGLSSHILCPITQVGNKAQRVTEAEYQRHLFTTVKSGTTLSGDSDHVFGRKNYRFRALATWWFRMHMLLQLQCKLNARSRKKKQQ